MRLWKNMLVVVLSTFSLLAIPRLYQQLHIKVSSDLAMSLIVLMEIMSTDVMETRCFRAYVLVAGQLYVTKS